MLLQSIMDWSSWDTSLLQVERISLCHLDQILMKN